MRKIMIAGVSLFALAGFAVSGAAMAQPSGSAGGVGMAPPAGSTSSGQVVPAPAAGTSALTQGTRPVAPDAKSFGTDVPAAANTGGGKGAGNTGGTGTGGTAAGGGTTAK